MIKTKDIKEFNWVEKPKANILIIYTGGTLGMDYDENGALAPCGFEQVFSRVPVLKELNVNLSVISFEEPIDSSNVAINHWQKMAEIIYSHYDKFDGFIVLHGTDTMAYSASAVSYMLNGLNKPVIFTGAQLPIASPRSDGHDNFITSVEIAADKKDGKPIITEVCIFFNHVLLRGNRSKKVESQQFDAFESENYPILAEAGISIDYRWSYLKPYNDEVLELYTGMEQNVAILKLFPSLSNRWVERFLADENLKGVVLESYGAGNVPNSESFIALLKQAVATGKIILNISQCNGGNVVHGKYETSSALDKAGVLSGSDMTSEAAITKMMFAFERYTATADIKKCLITPIRGELT